MGNSGLTVGGLEVGGGIGAGEGDDRGCAVVWRWRKDWNFLNEERCRLAVAGDRAPVGVGEVCNIFRVSET